MEKLAYLFYTNNFIQEIDLSIKRCVQVVKRCRKS